MASNSGDSGGAAAAAAADAGAEAVVAAPAADATPLLTSPTPPPQQQQQHPQQPTLLNELEAQLRAPDAVLEPGACDLVRDYIRAGGKAPSAIDELSDGYLGYAHMADLVCEWLDIAEVNATSAPSASLASSSSLARAMSGSGRGFLAGGAAPSAAAAAGSRAAEVPDQFVLLQELVKERFDPAKFLSVFKRGSVGIDWLDSLIAARQGRQLIYDLSAANHSSPLLRYAMQRIMSCGWEEEVAAMGSSLASYFGVFHRLLVARLAAAAVATSPQKLASVAREVAASSINAQHTYVHAQQLMTALAGLPCAGAAVFRRLSQEVEAAAAARHGGAKVYQLQPLFTPLSASPAEVQAAQLVAEALSKSAPNLPGSGLSADDAGAGGSGSRSQLPTAAFVTQQLAAAEAPLVALQQLYQQERELDMRPLQHPQLLQLLLSGMFVAPPAAAAGGGGHSMRELCVQLLALAVAGRAQQGHEQQLQQLLEEPQQLLEEPQQLLEEPQQQQQQQQQRRSFSPEVPAMTVAAVQQQLVQARELSAKMSAAKLKPGDLDVATQVCRLPVAALGLLQHSQRVLAAEGVYAEDRIIMVLPNHLSVLHRVAWEQPGLIPQVLGVLRHMLTALGSNQQELSKAVLSFLVSLLVSGAADLALPMAEAWAASADPSLIRHFTQLVLESVEPPYSQAFARSMLTIMQKSLIVRSKLSAAAMLRRFAAGAAAVTFLPPLSKRDQDLLDELGS